MKRWCCLPVVLALLGMGLAVQAAQPLPDPPMINYNQWDQQERPALFVRVSKALEGRHDQLRILLGLAQLGSGKEALPLLEEAIRLAPDDPLPHSLLGITLQGSWDGRLAVPADQRDYVRAAAELEIARKLEPDNGRYDLFLVIGQQMQGHTDQALKALEALRDAGAYRFDQLDLLEMQLEAVRAAGMLTGDLPEKLWGTTPVLQYLPLRDLLNTALPDPTKGDPGELPVLERRQQALVRMGRLLNQGELPSIERGIGAMLLKKSGMRMAAIYDAKGASEQAAAARKVLDEGQRRGVVLKADAEAGKGLWPYYQQYYMKK